MKTKISTLIFLSVGLMSVACEPGHKKRQSENSHPSFEQANASSCATNADTAIASDAFVVKDDVTLVRKSMRVVRLKCEGGVDSDKIEVVKEPKAAYEISAKSASHWNGLGKRLGARKAFNRTTCNPARFDQIEYPNLNASEGIFSGNFDGSYNINFVLEYGPSETNTPVQAGLNYIDYEFWTYCSPKDLDCKPKIAERGTYILNVTFVDDAYDAKTESLIEKRAENCPVKN